MGYGTPKALPYANSAQLLLVRITMATKRNYAAEYKNYQGTPKQLAAQSERHKARRAYEKAHGTLPDDMDVDHKKAMSKGGTSALGNLRAATDNANRSFSRTKTGDMKSQISKRERKK
jgi:5-methylcytosine-specific restriction endonuclease McrA